MHAIVDTCARNLECGKRMASQVAADIDALAAGAHGGPEHAQLVSNGVDVAAASIRGLTSPGSIGEPIDQPYGNGVLLWPEREDFNAAVARAVEMNAEIFMSAHFADR